MISWLLRKRIWNLKPHTKHLVANYLGLCCKLLSEARFTQVRNHTSTSFKSAWAGLQSVTYWLSSKQHFDAKPQPSQWAWRRFSLKKNLETKDVGSPLGGEMPSWWMLQTCKTSILPRLYLHHTTKRFSKLLCIWNLSQKTHSVQLNTVQIQAYQSAWFLSILARCEAGGTGPHCLPVSRCQLSFPRPVQVPLVAQRIVAIGGTKFPWAMSYHS